jgi:hypothetical protein
MLPSVSGLGDSVLKKIGLHGQVKMQDAGMNRVANLKARELSRRHVVF